MPNIERQTNIDLQENNLSFKEIYEKVSKLNQQKQNLGNETNLNGRQQLDSQVSELIKQLNGEYSLGLDNTSLDLQAVNGKLQIDYRDSQYGGGDRKVQIIIDENVAHKIVYEGYDGGNILFEKKFEKQSGHESAELTPEQMATQKFDEIINRISKKGRNEVAFLSPENKFIHVGIETKDGNQRMYIKKDIDKDKFTYYALEKTELNEFLLRVETLDSDNNLIYNHEFVPNLTANELLDDILLRFEKRLKEAEDRDIKMRKEELQRASEYAQNQDKKEADNLLNNLG